MCYPVPVLVCTARHEKGEAVDRLNHVKIVTPDPEAIDSFLREVLEVPEGWKLGEMVPATGPASSPARGPDGEFTIETVSAFRGAGGLGGLITGSTESRQFQILQGEKAHVWGVAIGTRHLERAHERCVARGIPCTEPALTAWGDGGIRFFFAEVGGIVFEVMRAETAGP
jgi:catechol 2,3-dioxygenase-like lactoylglutathione lyase family enzyme